jgi:hypothetical protein
MPAKFTSTNFGYRILLALVFNADQMWECDSFFIPVLLLSELEYICLFVLILQDKFQREFRARLRAMKFCSGNRADSPNSEVSDFDRSKVSAPT